MAKNLIQSDQIIHNAALSELAPGGDAELLAILPVINSRVKDPFSLSVSGLVLTVGPSIVESGPDGKLRGTPQLDSVDLGLLNGTFEFTNGPGGALIVTGNAQGGSIPAVTTDYFIRVGTEVRSDKNIYVVFGAPAALAANAGAPAFSEGVIQCGELLLQEDGAGGFISHTDQSGVTQFGTGSGGGGSGTGLGNINYVVNFKGDIDTNNWETYNDGSGSPTDGVGGTVDPGWTFTKTETDPLRGKGSFLLTKPASNVIGHGVSTLLKAIDRADQGRLLEVSFDYEVAGTYEADLDIFLIVNTSTLVTPVGQKFIPRGKGRVRFQFYQTAGMDVTRLCVHQRLNTTNAYTMKLDLVSVGPVFETESIKAVVSESATHSFSVGDIVQFTGTVWQDALATPAAWIEGGAIGLVVEVIDSYKFMLLQRGFFRLAGTPLSAGMTYYLSENNPAAYTTFDNNQVQVELFKSLSSSSGFFDPKPPKRLDSNPNTSFHALKFTTTSIVRFLGGAIRTDDGMVIYSGSSTTEAGNRNFTLDLAAIVASPTDATLYWLYIDRYALGDPTTFTDTGRQALLAHAASHFVLLTTPPTEVDPWRFVEVACFKTATTGNAWSGTGSAFANRIDKHHSGIVPMVQPERKVITITSAGTTTHSHGLSGKPTGISALYFDGTNEVPVDVSAHLANVSATEVEISSTGLTFGSGEYLEVTLTYAPPTWNYIASAINSVESPWYTNTSVTTFAHNLPDSSFIRGISVLEHDVTAGVYRILPMPSSPVTGFDDDNIYLDWAGFSPSATLKYRVITGGHPVPAAVQKEIGGYTKFVGYGPGSYATLAAALADAVAGDAILVRRSESISTAIDVTVSDLKISFMPGVKLTVTAGTKGIILSGDRIVLERPWVVGAFAGTLTAGIEISGEDCSVDHARVESNNAGLTVTNSYDFVAASLRGFINGVSVATLGTITSPVADAGTDNNFMVRG